MDGLRSGRDRRAPPLRAARRRGTAAQLASANLPLHEDLRARRRAHLRRSNEARCRAPSPRGRTAPAGRRGAGSAAAAAVSSTRSTATIRRFRGTVQRLHRQSAACLRVPPFFPGAATCSTSAAARVSFWRCSEVHRGARYDINDRCRRRPSMGSTPQRRLARLPAGAAGRLRADVRPRSSSLDRSTDLLRVRSQAAAGP